MPDKNMTRITLPGRDRDADLYKLTRAWVDALEWEDAEYGAWNVNGKRPFGNSGKDGVAEDILEILGFTADEKCPTCHAVVTDRSKLHAYAHDLFRDIPKMLARLTPAPRPDPTPAKLSVTREVTYGELLDELLQKRGIHTKLTDDNGDLTARATPAHLQAVGEEFAAHLREHFRREANPQR